MMGDKMTSFGGDIIFEHGFVLSDHGCREKRLRIRPQPAQKTCRHFSISVQGSQCEVETPSPSSNRNKPLALTAKDRISFGMGGAVYAVKEAAYIMFVLLFYTQVLGLSGTATGLVLFLAIVWDKAQQGPRPIAGNDAGSSSNIAESNTDRSDIQDNVTPLRQRSRRSKRHASKNSREGS